MYRIKPGEHSTITYDLAVCVEPFDPILPKIVKDYDWESIPANMIYNLHFILKTNMVRGGEDSFVMLTIQCEENNPIVDSIKNMNGFLDYFYDGKPCELHTFWFKLLPDYQKSFEENPNFICDENWKDN